MLDRTISRWYSTVTSEAFMKVLFPGAVLVIDAMDDGESRSIGSSNILSWKKLGMVGLVTGGGLADTDEIIYHKVPVWFRRLARGIRPGRNELESVNRPVTIGGVLWVGVGEPATQPPQLAGFVPLRSLQVRAGVAALEAAASAKADADGLLEMTQGSQQIRLLLACQERDETLIHVLLKGEGSVAERVAASRAVEALRRKAEALEMERDAP